MDGEHDNEINPQMQTHDSRSTETGNAAVGHWRSFRVRVSSSMSCMGVAGSEVVPDLIWRQAVVC